MGYAVDICHHNLWAVAIKVVAFFFTISNRPSHPHHQAIDGRKKILIEHLPEERIELSHGVLCKSDLMLYLSLFYIYQNHTLQTLIFTRVFFKNGNYL